MKIVDAYWEKRNLGVNCTEIEIEPSDKENDIIPSVLDAQNEYTVVKVPNMAPNVLSKLQKLGFEYIESSFKLVKRLNEKPQLPNIYKRYEQYIEIDLASKNEVKHIIGDIASGNIFVTDRIAIDPYFSEKQAGKRYANWISDLMAKDSCYICVAKYKGENMAFGIIESLDNKSHAVLGGLFSNYSKSSMGFLNVYANTLYPFSIGDKSVHTHISSNNLPILKLHMLFGYSIESINYVLIKHS